ncbi:hypothetical protein CRG98_041720 [Punica granatum]|uniref:Uncharacterized protein n=1 Tax=Punica granatum TaxID=22663 RepID=A0A2I0I1Q6_PUNGR|nr:hypothetical protein CRG98_041720 [Punica granatum]
MDRKSPDESGRIGSDRTARRRNRPEERWAGWGKLGLAGLGLGPRKKNELGRGPLAEGRPGSGGGGGDEAGGGGSHPWTPRRRPEWTPVTILDTADASPWSIGTSPALNQSESGELSRFPREGFPKSIDLLIDFGRFGGNRENRDFGGSWAGGVAGHQRALPGPAWPARIVFCFLSLWSRAASQRCPACP